MRVEAQEKPTAARQPARDEADDHRVTLSDMWEAT